MELHVHAQIAPTARTGTEGKWRAPDSLGYNEHIGAVAAIVSQHLEEAALVAAFLNGAFGFCLGCEMYLLIRRIRPDRRALADPR